MRRLALAAGVAASIILSGCAEQEPSDEEWAEIFFSNPETSETWRLLYEEFPEEFAQLTDGVSALEPSSANYDRDFNAILDHWFNQQVQSALALAKQAPPDEILAWRRSTLTLHRVLLEDDPTGCANLSRANSVVTASDPTEETKAANRDANHALFVAAIAGRDRPTDYGRPSEEEFAALNAHIANSGLSDRVLSTTTVGMDAFHELTDTEQCAFSIALIEATLALPDESAARMTAFLEN